MLVVGIGASLRLRAPSGSRIKPCSAGAGFASLIAHGSLRLSTNTIQWMKSHISGKTAPIVRRLRGHVSPVLEHQFHGKGEMTMAYSEQVMEHFSNPRNIRVSWMTPTVSASRQREMRRYHESISDREDNVIRM